MNISNEAPRRAFSIWLRTGQRPSASDIELKFNPWHDPEDGRFTFAGAGRYYGSGGASIPGGQGRKVPKVEYIDDFSLPSITSMEKLEAWRAGELAKHGSKPGYREAIEARYQQYKRKLTRPTDNQANKLREDGKNQSPPPAERSFRSASGGFTAGGGGSSSGGGATDSWGNPPAPATGPSTAREHQSREQDGFNGGGGSFGAAAQAVAGEMHPSPQRSRGLNARRRTHRSRFCSWFPPVFAIRLCSLASSLTQRVSLRDR